MAFSLKDHDILKQGSSSEPQNTENVLNDSFFLSQQ